jgi:hypothetical protein
MTIPQDTEHRPIHAPGLQDEAGAREIEQVAQWLHDEGGFDEAWQATWPEHAGDTGQRDGGHVRLVPSDVLAKFRDVATRLVSRFPGVTAFARPTEQQAVKPIVFEGGVAEWIAEQQADAIPEGAVPLAFYDASDPARRVATLAEAFERGGGKVSVVGWRQLIADLNAALASPIKEKDNG